MRQYNIDDSLVLLFENEKEYRRKKEAVRLTAQADFIFVFNNNTYGYDIRKWRSKKNASKILEEVRQEDIVLHKAW